jgi:uracil-DNA glycosylase
LSLCAVDDILPGPVGIMVHQSPDRREIAHFRWWVGLEIGVIRPQVTLAPGASAAFALTGNAAPLGKRRGLVETGLHDGPVLMRSHPARMTMKRCVRGQNRFSIFQGEL